MIEDKNGHNSHWDGGHGNQIAWNLCYK